MLSKAGAIASATLAWLGPLLTAAALTPSPRADAAASTLKIRVSGDSGEPIWARLEVYGPDGKRRWPPGAVLDLKSAARPEEAGYRSSFVIQGECEMAAEPGTYKIIAEHGLEFERVERTVEVKDQPVTEDIRLRRWVNARSLGWWSGDVHVHRPIEQIEALALAEDLNLSAVYTMWYKTNIWADKPFPKDPVVKISPHHLATVANAEDERGGGAWMLHQLASPVSFEIAKKWDPPGIRYVRSAREGRAKGALFPWFEVEKLIWWEAPVMIALETPDSVGVLHNHFTQYEVQANEAWGPKRDPARYPGTDGFVEYSYGLYYRYLNLGFRLPATAGSASGVLPNPVGYNRVYVNLDGKPFTVENWYTALREGRSFISNGPMLFFDARPAGTTLQGTLEVQAREPIERVEIVANGEVVKSFAASGTKWSGEFSIDVKDRSWAVARCFLKNPRTVRMAQSSPVYLPGRFDARADAQFFVDWITALIANSQDPKRFSGDAERAEVLALYDKALAFYKERATARP